ncbi:MAG: sigma-54 dependent transcriptional regulator [Deltaproteobacteria bacterium]|nr:sigma-54 dependent transcriptional regulator [Deltaproteobacteria bacterium]
MADRREGTNSAHRVPIVLAVGLDDDVLRLLSLGLQEQSVALIVADDLATARQRITDRQPMLVLCSADSVASELQATVDAMGSRLLKTHPVANAEWVALIIDRLLDSTARIPTKAGSAFRSTHAQWIIGDSPAIEQMLSTMQRIALADCPVLVIGETGTGKELVAKALHHGSERRGRFVALNCAAIPSEMIEAELFGSTKGAYTGAETARDGYFVAAHNGTLLLDEIGELSLGLQSKLLRVLQEREVTPVGSNRPQRIDTRVIAATHRNLSAMVTEGTFRRDLFHRLDVVRVKVPPLRERSEDVPLIVAAYLEREASRLGRPVRQLSVDALQFLKRQPWAGNVRELLTTVERGLLMRPEGVLLPEDFSRYTELPGPARETLRPLPSSDEAPTLMGDAPVLPPYGLDLRQYLENVERQLIDRALAECNGNKNKAAALLGIKRTTLVEKLRRLRKEPEPR